METWKIASTPVVLQLGSPGALASSGNLLEFQILGSHSRPTEMRNSGDGVTICILTSPPGDPDAL